MSIMRVMTSELAVNKDCYKYHLQGDMMIFNKYQSEPIFKIKLHEYDINLLYPIYESYHATRKRMKTFIGSSKDIISYEYDKRVKRCL